MRTIALHELQALLIPQLTPAGLAVRDALGPSERLPVAYFEEASEEPWESHGEPAFRWTLLLVGLDDAEGFWRLAVWVDRLRNQVHHRILVHPDAGQGYVEIGTVRYVRTRDEAREAWVRRAEVELTVHWEGRP